MNYKKKNICWSVGLFFASTVFGADRELLGVPQEANYMGAPVAMVPVQTMERRDASDQEIEAVRHELRRRAKLRCGCALVHGVAASVPAIVAASLKASSCVIASSVCLGWIPVGSCAVGHLLGACCMYCGEAQRLGEPLPGYPVSSERLERTLGYRKEFERRLLSGPGYFYWYRCYTCCDEGCSRT